MKASVKVLLTCEHASFACPPLFKLPLTQQTLRSHRGWDAGALNLAQKISQLTDWPLYQGKVTRLLIDLNRSLEHPQLYSRFSANLPLSQKYALYKRFYEPYHKAVRQAIEQAQHRGYHVLHLSLHSFTPIYRGEKRKTDIGLLFDPQRKHEKQVATLLKQQLRTICLGRQPLITHFNQPYKGTDDGLTQSLRGEFPVGYSGIEIECNQHLWRRYGMQFVAQIAPALAQAESLI